MTNTPHKVLVLDVGGSHVKVRMSGQRSPVKIVSGPLYTPHDMIASVQAATAGWTFDAASIGYPGPVGADGPAVEPAHLGPGWVGFDFARALGVPVRVINDAAMQAIGGFRGGHMLFLGLGTGLGSAVVVEGHLQPLELAHLPYRKERTFEEYVGEASRVARGNKRWRHFVVDMVTRLGAAMQCADVLLGGGNARFFAKHLGDLPEGTRLGGNADAFRGGIRLWQSPEERALTSRERSG
ncbi:MAG TPA: hypothetical protein VGM77_03985 [Gemmatimonadales bacterium]|jgi:polyphosphate glucokinase